MRTLRQIYYDIDKEEQEMKRLTARKIQTQDMIQVTKDELHELMNLNPWISLGQFDIENHLNKEGVIGYVAGDIHTLQMHKEDMKITHNSVHDCWFINKDFFETNYERV